MTTRTARPVAAHQQQGPARPLLLVEMADLSAAELLPAAAAQAAVANARLLVGIARPQPNFTTDAAIAHRAASRDREDCLQLLLAAHGMLEGTGVDYELSLTTYRQSRDPAKRARRIAAAMKRLARQRGALPLPVTTTSGEIAAGRSASVIPPARYRPAHVVAVLPDSAEAVRVARVAGEIARLADRPLALVVPIPGVFGPNSRGEVVRGYRRVSEDMAAIAGRVQPTLELLGVTARVYCAPYRTDGPARLLSLGMAAAIEEVAHLLRAQAVVVSATSPAAQHLRLSAGLHVVPAAVTDAPRLTARRSMHPHARR